MRLAPDRWAELLARWRIEDGAWRVAVAGLQPDGDGIYRPPPEVVPDLHVEGARPGTVRSVTWLVWSPSAFAYNVLPEVPAGKVFAGAAPPVMDHRSRALARTTTLSLPGEEWLRALPGPGPSGVLRISAEVETEGGPIPTARIEIRRGVGTGFRAGLSEQFGLPYVFGAGFLRRAGLRGPDTGAGNDCANFLVYAWRRSGLRIPWSNPAQLRSHLSPLAEAVRLSDRSPIPDDASERGLVIHLGFHVAALWEDRAPRSNLGPEDLLIHHLGAAPEVLTIDELLRQRRTPIFDLYLGPPRHPTAWVAVGGDVMPGATGGLPPLVRARLREADLAVANLEAAAGQGGKPAHKRYRFQLPSARLGDVRQLGISAVSLANNHSTDFGKQGLLATLDALDGAGVGHFGAGVDASSAASAWSAEAKGVSVAFVGASLTDPDGLPAGPNEPGLIALPRHERELALAIAAAKAKAPCVIAVVHWGDEGVREVTDEQRRWARWLVEHGADAVVGSGPHVIQAYEAIGGVPVYYSVGNLWFAGQWPGESRTAGLVFLGLDSSGRVVVSRLERLSGG